MMSTLSAAFAPLIIAFAGHHGISCCQEGFGIYNCHTIGRKMTHMLGVDVAPPRVLISIAKVQNCFLPWEVHLIVKLGSMQQGGAKNPVLGCRLPAHDGFVDEKCGACDSL
eukprot:21302-Amphidinium_carterae.1